MHAPPLGLTTRATCAFAVDGDTLEAIVEKRIRVRLRRPDLACWAPESRTQNAAEKRLGLASKNHLEYIAGGKGGRLWIPGDEENQLGDLLTLGRVYGDFWPDGPDPRSVIEQQIAARLASSRKNGPLGQ